MRFPGNSPRATSVRSLRSPYSTRIDSGPNASSSRRSRWCFSVSTSTATIVGVAQVRSAASSSRSVPSTTRRTPCVDRIVSLRSRYPPRRAGSATGAPAGPHCGARRRLRKQMHRPAQRETPACAHEAPPSPRHSPTNPSARVSRRLTRAWESRRPQGVELLTTEEGDRGSVVWRQSPQALDLPAPSP